MIDVSLKEQLNFLQKLLQRISKEQYCFKSSMLGNTSIGEHMRHVVEMLQCLLEGYASGTINYDRRKRDSQIETDNAFTASLLAEMINSLPITEKTLQIQQFNSTQLIQTTYNRELLYNLEHAIHHMALIKVALREMQLEITDDCFGVAGSTIRHRVETVVNL